MPITGQPAEGKKHRISSNGFANTAFFQHAPTATLLLDDRLDILDCNIRAALFFKTGAERIIGQNITVFYPDEGISKKKLRGLFRTSAESPPGTNAPPEELTCLDANGQRITCLHSVSVIDQPRRCFLLSLTPVPNTPGSPPLPHALIEDIISNSNIPYTIHVGDTIVALNEQAVLVHGGSSLNDFIGHSIMEFIPEEKHDEVKKQLDALYNGNHLPVIQGTIKRADGRRIPVEILDILIRYEQQPAVLSLFWEASHVQEERKRLATISECVSGLTGTDFFEALVSKLSSVFEMDYILIGEVVRQPLEKIQTLAFCHRGKLLENFSYDVRNTPCSQVVANTSCVYPTGIQKLYPDDRFFARHNIETYIGIPLSNAAGEVIGLIVVMNQKVVEDTENIVSLLKIFSVRAAAEIERRQYEQKINKSRSIFHTLAEASPAFIFMTDDNGHFIYTNRHWQKTLGRDLSRLQENEIAEIIHEDDRENVLKSWRRAFRRGEQWNQEFRIVRADGSDLWVLGKAVPLDEFDGQLGGYLGLCTDITQLKENAETLRTRNKELKVLNEIILESNTEASTQKILATTCRLIGELVDFPHVIVSEIDKDMRVATVVAEWRKSGIVPALGHTTDITGEELFATMLRERKHLHIEDIRKDPRLDFIRDELEEGKITSLLLLPIIAQNRLIATISLYTVAYRGSFSTDEITLLRSIIMQVEAAIERAAILSQKDLLSTAVEKTADGIIITDAEGIIQYVNPAFTEMSGFTLDEIRGEICKMLYSPNQCNHEIEDMWAAITAGKAWHGTILLRRKDGNDYYDSVQVSPVVDQTGCISHFVSVHRDKTNEIELERQLRHSQKMEAIGLLAGGIAHDFNNILTAIMGHASLPLIGAGGITPDMPVYNELQEIQKNAERASQLTRQLLTFARKQITTPAHIDINDNITSLMSMMQRLLHDNIILTIETQARGTVFIDPGQFEQVMVNLIVNARDAMPEGGKLYIRTRNHYLHDRDPMIKFGGKPGEYIIVEVHDTGIGMPDDVVEHIFEPFFTTKPAGKGSGLGLATCFGIIKQHDGFFRVVSEVDKGTIFKIFLPLSRNHDAAQTSQHVQDVLPRMGSETILVAEDEESVRQFIATALKQQGYSVHVCENGQEALETMEGRKGAVDLILTDIVMPIMGGLDLAKKARDINAQVKIMYMTGYTDENLDPVLLTDSCILQKPFSPALLLQTVRQVLDFSSAATNKS